ncbi:MAG: hypothetical protein ABIN94_09550 [Ferruginibacter sp.]
MKTQSNSLFSNISKQQMGELTNVVKETLASSQYESQTKIFTAADLWNIQRMGFRRTQRRATF